MSEIVTKLVAEKHRLIGERDLLMRKIAAVADAIDVLQEIECPPGGADQMGPEKPREEPQAAPAPTSLTPAPALLAEKAVSSPDAPPPQPEAVHTLPAPPAAPIRLRPFSNQVAETDTPLVALTKIAWATDERCAILRKNYPKRSITSREIMTALAASPGPRIPDWGNIGRFAQDVLGLAPTNRSHAQPANKKPEAIPISYSALISKGAEWGCTAMEADTLLAEVNAKAARLGLRPYALQSRSP